MLRDVPLPSHPDLIVGLETGDDAAVWRRPDGRAIIATVDFFTPVVDDARTWGAIAAANAVSDVYAMGGKPLFALNIAAWPKDQLPLDLLGQVMAGAQDIAARGGFVVVGGHTIDGAEPLFGQVVIGDASPETILTNAGAQVGDALVLTKALGTGLVTTAIKRADDGATVTGAAEAIASMLRLNDGAAAAAIAAGAHAATDVTGFGLLGHLHKLALASRVAVRVDFGAIPVLPGVGELAASGFAPGGTQRNLDFAEPHVVPESSVDWPVARLLLADPQTSGGLLFSCPRSDADNAVAALLASGHAAAVIGVVIAGPPGHIAVT